MSRLDLALSRARAEERPLFVPYWTLGDPDETTCLEVLRALVASGADALELGIPFSDPPADGPVIQAAHTRALSAGMTPSRALGLVATLRRETTIPILLMAYANLVLQHEGGSLGFCRAARETGVDALLLPDVPVEETGPFLEASRDAGLGLAQMITELTPPPRAARIAAAATSYLYVVGRTGTTGTHAGLGERLTTTIAMARAASEVPLLVGFGIASARDVARVGAAGADGAIVGSALVREAESGAGGLAARVGARAGTIRACPSSAVPGRRR